MRLRIMSMIAKTIEELLYYATINLSLNPHRVSIKRKEILSRLQVAKPYIGEIDKNAIKKLPVPDVFVNAINEYAINTLKLDDTEAERLTTGIMGLVTPSNKLVNERFDYLLKSDSNAALDYLFNLSVKNDYIKKTFVDRNITSEHKIDGKDIIISINLAKPEKNNKDIAKLLSVPQQSIQGFPKCVLCHKNVGFAGGGKFPPRQNLRDIALDLDGNIWHLQYSPYVYFPYHMIVIDNVHRPMHVSKTNTRHLLSFLDYFPDAFISSNSDLPIIGGSILNHEHFQGGKFLSPIFRCSLKKIILPKCNDKPEVGIVDWFNNVIRLRGENKEKVLSYAMEIIEKWKKYSDEKLSIIASSDAMHNSVTLMAKKDGPDYLLYIALRNNRCSSEYPLGIFHAHPEYHIIKKEGIGISEVMGIFILPARLKRQCDLVDAITSGKMSFEECIKNYPDMSEFKHMIDEIQKEHISSSFYMARACARILENCAVFKNDSEGEAGFSRFISTLKFKR